MPNKNRSSLATAPVRNFSRTFIWPGHWKDAPARQEKPSQVHDDPFQTQRAARADALQRRQPDHLRSIKEKLLGPAFARVHGELRDRLAELFPDREAQHLASHFESVNVNHFANITAYWTRCAAPKCSLRIFNECNHKPVPNYAIVWNVSIEPGKLLWPQGLGFVQKKCGQEAYFKQNDPHPFG